MKKILGGKSSFEEVSSKRSYANLKQLHVKATSEKHEDASDYKGLAAALTTYVRDS